MTLDPTERANADPVMVGHLMQAMTSAMAHASIPDVTTSADVLSAVFTVLDRTLRVVRTNEDPAGYQTNAREIGRVLTQMLLEFGTEPGIKH